MSQNSLFNYLFNYLSIFCFNFYLSNILFLLLEILLNDMDINFLRLDGSTPVKDRQQLIDEFNQGSYEQAAEDGEKPIPVSYVV